MILVSYRYWYHFVSIGIVSYHKKIKGGWSLHMCKHITSYQSWSWAGVWWCFFFIPSLSFWFSNHIRQWFVCGWSALIYNVFTGCYNCYVSAWPGGSISISTNRIWPLTAYVPITSPIRQWCQLPWICHDQWLLFITDVITSKLHPGNTVSKYSRIIWCSMPHILCGIDSQGHTFYVESV